MCSKRKPESEATVNMMMYSAKEVENIVMDAIRECTTEDCEDEENGGRLALITMLAGAKIMSKVTDILQEKK